MGFAFGRIESALTVLVANLSELSGLAAKTERIDALFTGGCHIPVRGILHAKEACDTLCAMQPACQLLRMHTGCWVTALICRRSPAGGSPTG